MMIRFKTAILSSSSSCRNHNRNRNRKSIPYALFALLNGFVIFSIVHFWTNNNNDDNVRSTTASFFRRHHHHHHHRHDNVKNISSIYFVHVGKTGGTSIGSMLRIFCVARQQLDSRQYCFQQLQLKYASVDGDGATATATAVAITSTTANNITSFNIDTIRIPNESKISQLTNGFMHVTGYYPSPLSQQQLQQQRRSPRSSSSTTTSSSSSSAGASTENPTLETASHFLISLRNPMERITSWFYYLHPMNCYEEEVIVEDDEETEEEDERGETTTNGKRMTPHKKRRRIPRPRQPHTLIDKACITKQHLYNTKKKKTREYRFYEECFPTINEFVMSLLLLVTTSSGESQQSSDHGCTRLAWETLQGYGGPNGMAGHVWANYTYYYKHTIDLYPSKQILVVRTNSLWQDLQMIENQITAMKNSNDDNNNTNSSNDNIIFVRQQQQQQAELTEKSRHLPYHKDKLTLKGYSVLCCAMQDEIFIYQQILYKAMNLNGKEKEITMYKILRQCYFHNSTEGDDDSGSARDKNEELSTQDLKQYCSETYPTLFA